MDPTAAGRRNDGRPERTSKLESSRATVTYRRATVVGNWSSSVLVRRVLIVTSIFVLVVAGVYEGTRDETAEARTVLTREAVEHAFAREGFALQSGPPLGADGVVLHPINFKPFRVFVLRSEALASEEFEPYRTHALDAFNLLRTNVFVTSDSGLTKYQRDRIRAAMSLLTADDEQ
jgi:hypothetical protein